MRPVDYRRMVETPALDLARDFMLAEADLLRSVAEGLLSPLNWSLVVVGGAASSHLAEPARQFGSYVVVDPLATVPEPSDENLPGVPATIACPLDGVDRADLPPSPALWLFTFNVYPYIANPLGTIKWLAAPGDLVIITTWAATPPAQSVRTRYLEHVFGLDTRRAHAAAAGVDLSTLEADLLASGLEVTLQDIRGEIIDAAVLHLTGARQEELW